MTGLPATDADVARLAYAMWEAEGQPEGRDKEHWFRAREIIDGGTDESGPDEMAEPRDEVSPQAARPVKNGETSTEPT